MELNATSSHKYESVRVFICGLGRRDFHHLVRVLRVKLYWRVINSEYELLNNLFRTHCLVLC